MGRITFLIFFITSISLSQVYFFKRYDTRSGLIQNTIRVIHQDSLGRLWIGTAEGLNIYDGEEFISYSYNNELNNSIVTCFYTYNNSIMLAGTNGKGIIAFLKNPFGADTLVKTFSGEKYLINDHVNKILKDSKNNYWICTDSGITKWTLPSSGISEEGLKKIEVKHFGKDEGVPGKYINGTIDSAGETIWFNSDAGLIRCDGENFIFETDSIKGSIHSIFAEGDSLIIAASNKLLTYRNGKIKNLYELPDNYVVAKIVKDSKSIFWFATTRGLLKYEKNNFSWIDRTSGLEEDFIISLLEDREGNIWIGSINGLFKYSRDSFLFLKGSESLPHILSFKTDKTLIPWIVTAEGLYKIEKNQLVYSKLNVNFKGIGITDINFISEDEALISTSKGIFQIKNYSNSSGSIIKILGENELSHLLPDYPYTATYKICIDKEKNIWAQNKEGKIFIITGNNVKLMNSEELRYAGSKIILPKDLATCMFNDSYNNIWLGYFNQGLFKISEDSIIKFSAEQGFEDTHIRSLFEDTKGNIWIGTRHNGVFKYSGGKFTRFSSEDGLNSHWITTISEDNTGNLWFGTGKGVMKYDGKVWKIYDETRGIKAGEMSFSATGNDGTVYINSLNGIYFYNPYPEPKAVLPIVLIKKFQYIDGKKIDHYEEYISDDNILFKAISKEGYSVNSAFEFSYDQNSFTFEFASASLTNEENTLYTYRLEGFEDRWSPLAKRNFINYVNLPAGKYKFLVKAKNYDQSWSEFPAEISFIITPPFWEAWWFRVLAFSLIVITVALVTTIINRYRSLHALKIERMRTKIATDLHDDIGTSLSSIAIFSQLAKRKKNVSAAQLNEYLEKIEETSGSLIEAMDDIVWSINPQNDSLEDAILKMENYAGKLLEAKGIDLQMSVSTEITHINLSPDLRRNILLIFKEIVTNAAKHSNANQVKINISVEDSNRDIRKIFIHIEDDGTGFNPDEVFKGNGIKNLQARTAAVKGDLKVISEKNNKGTKYFFSLSLDN